MRVVREVIRAIATRHHSKSREVHEKSGPPFQNKALHYRQRTVEDIEIDGEAWVSFYGKFAYPARVLEKDDCHYTVQFECRTQGLNPGSRHLFRLDEVRTTPLLACINMVTF